MLEYPEGSGGRALEHNNQLLAEIQSRLDELERQNRDTGEVDTTEVQRLATRRDESLKDRTRILGGGI